MLLKLPFRVEPVGVDRVFATGKLLKTDDEIYLFIEQNTVFYRYFVIYFFKDDMF